MNHPIRKAKAEDMPAVLALITELAVFENEPDAVHISVETLITYGTGANPLFTCFVAEDEEEIVGMALVYYRFSTWEGKSLHLEDLIVSKKYRGKGYGKALYNQVMRYAVSQDVNRVEWVVLDWNTDAITFYENSGALFLKDWHLVQMNKERLQKYIHSIS
ncbi:GNAT family N-acetyltransferase [uncultured Dokdonia sp.]|uniref:GNAT family N-acetyltransferase n=1 Tax=uncultured Dokdonia sp. TaxID=575653 RepID=UPI00260F247A|nr:GNAT family N-acetyltransferase [uncultured Dokdonia sp.]